MHGTAGLSAIAPGKNPMRPRRKSPSKLELAWLAGFVDGEGSIYISAERRPGNRYVLKGRMSVDNTDLKNIRKARSIAIQITGRPISPIIANVRRGYRPCYSLRFQGQSTVAALLRELQPWLIGKHRRATLMLRFIASAPRSATEGRAGRRARTRDKRRWARCYTRTHFAILEEMRRLNRRYGRGEWQSHRWSSHRAKKRPVRLRAA